MTVFFEARKANPTRGATFPWLGFHALFGTPFWPGNSRSTNQAQAGDLQGRRGSGIPVSHAAALHYQRAVHVVTDAEVQG